VKPEGKNAIAEIKEKIGEEMNGDVPPTFEELSPHSNCGRAHGSFKGKSF